ncbi:MAG: NUDIX hydrolase [Bacteroidales bacterium]
MKVSYKHFVETLKARLEQPLPGFEAQRKLEPVTRKTYLETADQNKARYSGVMALFYACDDQIRLVFIRRTEYNGVHSGQISFPGGRYEPGDENLKETALRETFEEIGVPADKINVIGKLTDLYIPPSNFMVEPYVGYLDAPLQFVPDPAEVNEIFSVSLDDLLKTKNLQTKTIETAGRKIDVACYFVEGKVIWGATSMILSELLDVIREAMA